MMGLLVPVVGWSAAREIIVGAPVSAASGSDTSSYSLASIAAGIGPTDYPLLVCAARASGNRTLSSVTFGGVAGTILYSPDVDAGGNTTMLSFVVGPIGATGTVQVNYTAGMVRFYAACYPVRGVTSWTALDPTGIDSTSLNIDVPSNGVVFAAAYSSTGQIWSGITQDWTETAESNSGSGGYYIGPSEAGRAISCTGANGLAAIGLV